MDRAEDLDISMSIIICWNIVIIIPRQEKVCEIIMEMK